MKVALFLGAGASAFVGHPTTKELMDLVRKHVEARKDEPHRDRNCQKYIMGVVSSETYSDVEKLYDGVEQIINTHTNPNCEPITSRTGDINTGLQDLQTVTELKDLLSIINNILLQSFIIRQEHQGHIKMMYDKIRSVMEIKGTANLQIFTTNYDLVMEEYATKDGYEVVNGFKPNGHMTSVWDNAWEPHTEHSMYLTKLHGSINWHSDADGQIIETGGIQNRDESHHDVMISPTEGAKDYNKEPFQTLMGHFKESLKNVEMLLVIGSSYRDDEINKIIKRRLDEGMLLISVSPSALADITSISNAKHHQQEWNNSQFVVLDSKIALCDKEFGPDTIEDVCSTLYAIFMYFQDNEARKSRIVL